VGDRNVRPVGETEDSMLLRMLSIALLSLATVAWAGCGDDDDDGGTTTAAQTETQEQKSGDAGGRYREAPDDKPDGTAIKLAASPVGDALFDGDDQAIYLFDAEESDKPECYDDCAAAWPPVLTEGKPVAEGPIEQGLLGTTKRDDGTTQVTYNGHPLYYYAHEGPGELRCHNVSEFGGLWLALDETGSALS
jgi:predicted lipoprotein with Yx(FWY)xxD motif